MSLTWRDVAGTPLRAPDLTDSAEALTRGIAGFSKAVTDIANAPMERELARLSGESNIAKTRMVFAEAHEQKLKAQAKEEEAARERAALKEFGAVQSVLEAQVYEAARKGQSYDDFMKKNDTYLRLSSDARSMVASRLSDVFRQGFQAFETDQRWQKNFALQQAQEARAQRESAFRVQALQRAVKAAEGGDKGDYTGVADPESRAALMALRNRVLPNLARASGAAYSDRSLTDVAKMGGIDDLSEATSAFTVFNADRARRGLDPLPEDVMKELLAGGSGKNTFPFSIVNDYDPDQFIKDLEARGTAYDAAWAAERLLRDRERFVREGGKLSDASLEEELARLIPAATRPARVPVAGKPGVNMPARAEELADDFRFYVPKY